MIIVEIASGIEVKFHINDAQWITKWGHEVCQAGMEKKKKDNIHDSFGT